MSSGNTYFSATLCIYSVSNRPPPRFSDIFSQTVGDF